MRILVDSSTLIALAKILLAARREDRLVLDDANARRFAEFKGLRFTGLIGLLVAAVKTKSLKRLLHKGRIRMLCSFPPIF